MTEGKSINLLKAAKELNIGIGTAVDFLGKNGFDVESKPNTKLSSDMYAVLLREFQGDKNAKDEAKQIIIGKIRRDEPTLENTAADQESISSKNEEFAGGDEILIKNVSTGAVEKAPTEEKEEQKVEEQHPSTGHLKVVGKIDLDSFNKNRPKKVSVEKVENKPIPVPKEEPIVEEEKVVAPAPPSPVVEAPEIKVEEKPKPVEVPVPVEEIKKPEEKPVVKQDQPASKESGEQDEMIPTRYEKLEGPKVIGKIELPTFKPKDKPVASSSNPNQDNKRKRKRTNKPGTSAPDQSRPQQGGPGRGNPPAGGVRTDNRHPNANRPAPGPHGAKGRHDNRGKGGRNETPKEELSEKEIQDQIKATLARLSGAGKSGKFAQRAKLRRQKRDDIASSAEEAALEQEAMSRVLRVTEFVTANELANLMDVPVTEVIATCMSLGMFVSINQRLDAETLSIVAEEFGYQIEFIKPEDEEIAELEEPDTETDLVPRAPIVTVMGHVDHGKTSLLDYIRKANVTKGEAGGITQHIGAYAVKLDDGRRMTFLDTPGHEAFTAMRARGAKVTDIVIIVIAADDAVMPQTKEAINHAQAANVPIVFAFTKVDKPGANPDKIREQLSAMNILVEDWGGKYQAQEISAKTGENVELLLEKVLLEAEMLELMADPKKRAVGSVIEAALDKGRGIVTTILVQGGTLRVGDPILAGSYSGKVKALTNERGERVKEAGPSVPVQILGMAGAPTAGDKLYVLESESEARQVANKRLQLQREQGMRATKHITLDEIGRRLAIGNFKELNVIVKGDVDGSIEALSDSLLKLSTAEIQVNIIHKSVGAISESDVLLASASDAIIIGFQVRPTQGARKLAENEQIDIRLYSIIYDAIEELKSAMEGMLAPKFEEKIVAEVQIRETFKISKVGTIAGCMVLDGKINRNNDIRVIRDGVVIHTGKLASLKRFKDDVKEVSQGYECGLNIDRFNDIQEGDIVEAYEQVEVKRKL